MIFTIKGKRYRVRGDVWRRRAGELVLVAAMWTLILAPIVLYIAPRL